MAWFRIPRLNLVINVKKFIILNIIIFVITRNWYFNLILTIIDNHF